MAPESERVCVIWGLSKISRFSKAPPCGSEAGERFFLICQTFSRSKTPSNTFAKEMKKAKDLAEEKFEILDVTNSNTTFIDRWFGDIKKTSPVSQLAVGGGSGWVTGYVVIKVGKAAALTLIVTGVALKLANDRGFITINRGAVNEAVQNLQEQANSVAASNKRTYTDMVKQIYHKYKYLSVGFAGGFLAAVLF